MSIYTQQQDPDIYWASWRTEDFLPHICQLRSDYFRKLEEFGLLTLWQECYNAYYSTNEIEGHAGSKISFVGPNNELVCVRAGLFRNLATYHINTIIANQPKTVPVASNDDYAVKAQIHACKNVLEHFNKVKKSPEKLRDVVEAAMLYGTGYLVQYWDQYDRDFVFAAASPRRVVTSIEPYTGNNWFIYTERRNKYDIAKKYNVKEDDLGYLTNIDIQSVEPVTTGYYFDTQRYDDEFIEIYHFFHAPTHALPDGRYTIFCNDHVSFTDHLSEKLPFAEVPIFTLQPQKIMESPFGYSPLFDLIGPQKLYNATLSTIFTGLDKAKTIVAVPSGTSDPMPVENDPNLSITHYPKDGQHSGVQVINTFSVPDELFKVLSLTEENLRKIIGVNSTVMGDSSAKSGSHAALLFSIAQQFSSATISAFVEMIEAKDTALIRQIKDFVNDPIMLQISGEDKEVYLKEFKREDISGISGVTAQAVSPLLSTPSGRLTIGQDLLQIPGSPMRVQDYLKLLDTGQLDSAYTDPRDEDMVLSAERNSFGDLRGLTLVPTALTRYDGTPDEIVVVEQVRAMIGDNHQRHLQSHMAQLSSPQIRRNNDLIRFLMAHVAEHVWLSKYGSRELLMASGQQPMPDPQGAQQAQMGQQQEPVPASSRPALDQLTSNRGGENQLPRNPRLPINPINPTMAAGMPRPMEA